MKDRYKELMRRSFGDAVSLADDFEQEYGLPVSDEMLVNMSMALYQHRVRNYEMKKAKMESEAQFPQGSPDAGRY